MVETTPAVTPEFPFESRFTNVEGFNIHYVEHGSGDPVLFFHGNPTSSYLWRNVFPRVAQASGQRAIAFDLLGFGKSDKPNNIDYSLKTFADIVEGFIDNLKLKNPILVGDDWGGLFAANYAVHHLENVRGLGLMETFLWPMTWQNDFAPEFRGPFKMMRSPLGFVFVQVLNIMTKKLIPQHCPISKESLAYYLNSTPSVRSRKAMAALPRLLPVAGKPAASYDFFMELQNLLAGIRFPVMWIKATPGIVPTDDYPPTLKRLEDLKKKIPHMVVKQFGPGHHFLAEENPERVAKLLVDWMREAGLVSTRQAAAR